MNALKPSTVLWLLLLTHLSRADPLDTWILRNPLPTGNRLHSITHGNGQFVAVGGGYDSASSEYNSTIVTSADGVNWVQRQAGTTNALLVGIAFGNGQFVAVGNVYGPVGDVATILTSSDATNWI